MFPLAGLSVTDLHKQAPFRSFENFGRPHRHYYHFKYLPLQLGLLLLPNPPCNDRSMM